MEILGLIIALLSLVSTVFSSLLFNNIAVWMFSVGFAAIAAVISLYRSDKNRKKNRIFISYHWSKREKAVELAAKLTEFGYKPWLDINEILPGQNIIDELRKGIEISSVFLMILSGNNESSFVSKELEMAMSLMRSRDKTFSPIIPIIIDDISISSVPESLKSIQWIDLRGNKEEGYKKLKEALKRILDKDS